MIKQLIAVYASTAGLSLAQQTGISGRLTDPCEARVAGAKVTAASDEGSKAATLTNSQGLYQFPTLGAAKYVLRFEAPGFTVAERTLSLLLGQVATVDVSLQLATASSFVAVEASPPALDTSRSQIEGNLNPAEGRHNPLSCRDLFLP